MAEEDLEEDYEFWCLCENDQQPFRFFISPTKIVFDLKMLIVEGRFKGNYHAAELTLTKVRHIMISMQRYDLITSRRLM
jgi:hypothetical protein